MDINQVIGYLIAGLVLIVFSVLAKKAEKGIVAWAEKTENADLKEIVQVFCEAAEQMFKIGDDTGKQRKTYVKNMLTICGIDVTEEVNAMIEAAVYQINRATETKND